MNQNQPLSDFNEAGENRHQNNSTEIVQNISPRLYGIPTTCPPEQFDQFNNSSNFEGKTNLPSKSNSSKKKVKRLFFFNEFSFTSAREIIGGGPLSTSKKNKKMFARRFKNIKEKHETEGQNDTDYLSSYPISSLLGEIFAENLFFPKQPDFQKTDFFLSNNQIGLNLINGLMELPCQINVPYLKYVLQNLHFLVEIGILPSLEIRNSPDIKANKREFTALIETFYNYHTRLLALNEGGKKTKILFTGKRISLTDNGLPHALDTKLEKTLLKKKKSALLSLQGISHSFNRSLKTGWSYINAPVFFSMKFDTRGRLYYRGSFSPLLRPFGRNILRFVTPCLIKTGSSEEFIFFSELGLSIKQHSCYRDAFDFVLQNKEEIIDTLNNF